MISTKNNPLQMEPQIIDAKSENYVIFAEENTRIINTELYGTIFIGYSSYINSGLIRSYVEIGRYCSIGRNVSIGLGNHNINILSTSPFFEYISPKDTIKLAQQEPKRRVIIGHDVWIGDSVMIATGVRIGNGCVIAAGSVVTKDVEDYTIVGGVPAKFIKYRFEQSIIKALLKIEWWDINPKLLKKLPSHDIEKTIEYLLKINKKRNFFKQKYTRITPEKVKESKFKGSKEYWNERYIHGGNSGAGSYNALGKWKADTINGILKKINISNVIEWGCGDGNLLKTIQYPKYLGFDVSPKAISICQEKYHNDKRKSFQLVSEYQDEKADITFSLDVIYHLVEDNIYDEYMYKLFTSSNKYVVIYSSNNNYYNEDIKHVRHRKFTDWIENNQIQWHLIEHIKNDFPYNGDNDAGSISSFYLYKKL